MVYESDFYTTRRYRPSPSVSSYTISSVPSRQVRVLPGLGKVHIVHTYDRIVPYVGHKRLTVVTVPPPRVFSTRPSILHREYDRIENKLRPWVGYSATNRYLNSDSAVRFVYVSNPLTQVDTTDTKSKVYRPLNLYYDYYYPTKSLNSYADHWPNYDHLIYRYTYPSDRYYFLKGIFDGETRLIRAQTASLLKKIHAPVVRQQRPLPITTVIRYDAGDGVPARFTNDNYIYRLLTTSPRNPKVEYTTYYSEPVRKYIGDRAYNRRNHLFLYEDPLKSDIQLLSYYINKFRQEKKAIQPSSDKVENVEEKQPEIVTAAAAE